MAIYVDGFVIPVKRDKVADYVKLARLSAKVWREHGALSVTECMAEDAPWGKRTSFPRAVKLKADEVVWLSWITYKSRKDRDRIMAAVMKDKRLAAYMNPKALPFDAKRMILGGFKPMISA